MSSYSLRPSDTETGLLKDLLSKRPDERESAWEFLYKSYSPLVRDYIFKNSGGEDDATDIFQDALLILHRNLNNGTFREESSLKTYVFSICKNLWLKELSRRNKRQILSEELALVTDQDLEYLVNIETVNLLMKELKPDCRDILTEYYFNKRSMAELKEIFNVNSIQAAKNKKMRCLSYLVRIVKEKSNLHSE